MPALSYVHRFASLAPIPRHALRGTVRVSELPATDLTYKTSFGPSSRNLSYFYGSERKNRAERVYKGWNVSDAEMW